MIFEVAIGDRVRTVSVVRKGALLHVTLDGRVHLVDARRVNESAVSLLVQSGLEGTPVRSIDAAFAAQAGGRRLRRSRRGTQRARPDPPFDLDHAPGRVIRAQGGPGGAAPVRSGSCRRCPARSFVCW